MRMAVLNLYTNMMGRAHVQVTYNLKPTYSYYLSPTTQDPTTGNIHTLQTSAIDRPSPNLPLKMVAQMYKRV